MRWDYFSHASLIGLYPLSVLFPLSSTAPRVTVKAENVCSPVSRDFFLSLFPPPFTFPFVLEMTSSPRVLKAPVAEASSQPNGWTLSHVSPLLGLPAPLRIVPDLLREITPISSQ